VGRHIDWTYEGVASATPTPTDQGLVLIPDYLNNMRAYTLPELTPGGTLQLAWQFTEGGSPGGLVSRYCGTPVTAANGHAFWVNTRTSFLWGINTTSATGGGPTVLPWAPINLTAAANDDHFVTWNQESSILLHDSHIWIPATDEHEALSVNANTGEAVRTTVVQNNHRLFGSVGTTAESGHAVAFASSIDGLVSFDTAAVKLWGTNVDFLPVGQEFSHPVMFAVTTAAADKCIVMSRPKNGGLFIAGANPVDGKPCLSWGVNGYTVRTKYTETPTWVSAPALLPDGSGYLLFYGVNLPTLGGVLMSSLVSVKVDRYGVLSTTEVTDGVIFEGAHVNIAPIIFYNAFGSNSAAVAVILSTGDVKLFDAKGFTGADPRVSYAAADVLPMKASESGLETAGNYATATPAGTLMFMAYDVGTKDTYLVAIARAVQGRAPGPAPMPIPVGPAAPAPSGPSAGTVASAIFGVAGALGVAAAAVVFFAPRASFSVAGRTVVPADLIRSAASATASATASAAKFTYEVVGGAISKAAAAAASSSGAGAGGAGGASLERASLLRARPSAPAAGATAGYSSAGTEASEGVPMTAVTTDL
jgi:hypothetical protein